MHQASVPVLSTRTIMARDLVDRSPLACILDGALPMFFIQKPPQKTLFIFDSRRLAWEQAPASSVFLIMFSSPPENNDWTNHLQFFLGFLCAEIVPTLWAIRVPNFPQNCFQQPCVNPIFRPCVLKIFRRAKYTTALKLSKTKTRTLRDALETPYGQRQQGLAHFLWTGLAGHEAILKRA